MCYNITVQSNQNKGRVHMKKNIKNKQRISIGAKISNILILLFNIGMSLLFGVITYASTFHNHRSIIQIRPVIIFISCVAYVLITFLLYKIINKFIHNTGRYMIVLFCILIIIQVAFINFFRVDPYNTWDFGKVFSIAQKYVEGIYNPNHYNYLYIYNNNIAITLFLSFFFFIGKLVHYTNYMNIGFLINLFAIDIAILYTYKIIGKIFDKKYTKLFILLTITFTPFITFTPIFYSDTLSMPFVIISFYYLIKYMDEKNIKHLIFAGILIGIGSTMKFTLIILLIAFLIVSFLCEKKNLKLLKNLIIIVVSCLIPIILLKIYISINFDEKKLDELSFPAVHWINMGLHGYGGFTPEDVKATKSQLTRKKKMELNKKLIKKSIHNYYKNGELLTFYLNKEVYIWGDGQYYVIQQLERQPIHNYKFKKYILNYPENIYFEAFCQTQQILLLFFITIGALFNKYLDVSSRKVHLLSNISIFGLTMFLTIWEARSRYLVHYLPLIIISGLLGIVALLSFIKTIKKKDVVNMLKKMKRINLKPLLSFIPVIYVILFAIVIFLLLFISGVSYHLKRDFLVGNIFVMIPFLITVFLIYKFSHKKTKIDSKEFKKYLIILFAVIAILQTILITHIYFYTDWDVRVIRNIVKKFIETGAVKDDFYLSVYPNNILLTFILAFIKKIPFIGKYYITTLLINATLVNISGLLTALTLKNLKSEKAALLSYTILIPLILLSPWIVIPYSDTFALPCVTAIIYLYSKKDKKRLDYFMMGLITILGYKIKPTVIIMVMAIFIVEFLCNYNQMSLKMIRNSMKIVVTFLCGAIIAFATVKLGKWYLKFEPVSYAQPITYIHYLAMGQNDKTLGSYSQKDVDDTHNYGKGYDIHKFKQRVLSRSVSETIVFYTKKTILNFNDGSFCWGLDGTFFSKTVKAPNKFAKFLRQIYYSDGKYYRLFLQIQHWLWLLVLLYCPWIVKKNNKKEELVIMLSIIGLVLFLTIFEPRTRYMYCYSEVYLIAAILGLYNLKGFIDKNKNRSKTSTVVKK